jgi:hypothetical protein
MLHRRREKHTKLVNLNEQKTELASFIYRNEQGNVKNYQFASNTTTEDKDVSGRQQKSVKIRKLHAA